MHEQKQENAKKKQQIQNFYTQKKKLRKQNPTERKNKKNENDFTF